MARTVLIKVFWLCCLFICQTYDLYAVYSNTMVAKLITTFFCHRSDITYMNYECLNRLMKVFRRSK